MKSIAQIHQQTLDLAARLFDRKYTLDRTVNMVYRAHNRYLKNIAALNGVTSVSSLTSIQWMKPYPKSVYAN